MDIVYLVRAGELNDELRWSLRSLRNFPHDNVWIVGFKPRWVDAPSILTSQTRNKFASTANNLLQACMHPKISNEFVLMNDDFFFMKPIASVPTFNRGSLRNWIEHHLSLHGDTTYIKAAKFTEDILVEQGFVRPLSFSLHTPMVVNKVWMERVIETCSVIEVAKATNQPHFHLRTLYGNIAGLEGTTIQDVKVARGTRQDYQAKINEKNDIFLSTSDRSFRNGYVGDLIRQSFIEPSPYEIVRVKSRPARHIRRR